MPKTTGLTNEQIEAFESMIKRRMANTGETRLQAGNAILAYMEKRGA